MRGRKPIQFKALKGTERKDRINTEAPDVEVGIPSAPDGLTARAVEWFGRITSRLEAIGCASVSHTEMLALLARRLAEIEHYDELIELHGAVFTDDKGNVKGNPAVRMRSEAMRQAQSLLSEFGLSLASVSKVKSPAKKPNSQWGAYGS